MNENVDHTDPTRRLRVWHVLLCLFVFLILTWMVYYMRARADFKAACEKVRASGYPITLTELNEWYKLPDGEQNAADTILEAIDHFNEWDTEKRKRLPVLGEKNFEIAEPYDPNTLQLAEEYLRDNEQMITLLGNAAKIKHCRYPVDLEMGINCSLGHLGELKNAVRLLSIETQVYAEKNQRDKAIDTLETMAAIAHSLSKEPMLISQLVLIACDNMTTTTASRIISRCDLSDSQLNRLADMIKNMQTHSLISVGLVGERCFMASAIDDGRLRGDAYGNGWLDVAFVAARVTGLAYNDLVFNMELLTDAFNASNLSLTMQIKSIEAIRKKIDSLGSIHLVSRMTMSGTPRLVEIDLKYATNLRVAQIAIAAERWRVAHGQLPEKLDQLIPQYIQKIPIDPFDGNRLRYKKTSEGFIVYSIGIDKIDDGGLNTKMSKRSGRIG